MGINDIYSKYGLSYATVTIRVMDSYANIVVIMIRCLKKKINPTKGLIPGRIKITFVVLHL